MAKRKAKTAYVCGDCGADHAKWQGQCTACGAWNTLSEISVGPVAERTKAGGGYADSLDASFGAAYGLRAFLPNLAAFESLKSQGLGLVSDPELRASIARVYERTYRSLDAAMQAETNVVFETLRPYWLTRFRDLRFNTSATPIDYDFVMNDTEFRNLLDYRRQNIVQGVLPPFERASVDMRELIDAIDRDLGGGES